MSSSPGSRRADSAKRSRALALVAIALGCAAACNQLFDIGPGEVAPDAWSSASSAGNVSTALVVGGLVLVAAGGTFYLASPRPAARAAATLATIAGGAPLAW